MDNASAFSQVLRFLEEGLADLVSNIPAFRRGEILSLIHILYYRVRRLYPVCDRVQLFPGRHRDLSARLFRPELEKEKAAPRLGPAVNGCTRPHSPGLCVSPHRFAAVRPLAMRPRFIYNTF